VYLLFSTKTSDSYPYVKPEGRKARPTRHPLQSSLKLKMGGSPPEASGAEFPLEIVT
jgi:hypothetical protein